MEKPKEKAFARKRTPARPEDVAMVITLCPRDSHPSTRVVEALVRSMREHLPADWLREAHVVVAFDGNLVKPETIDNSKCAHPVDDGKYRTFKARTRRLFLRQGWRGVQFRELEERGCLTGNLRHGMAVVDAPYVFVVQGDLGFRRDLDPRRLASLMRRKGWDYVVNNCYGVESHGNWCRTSCWDGEFPPGWGVTETEDGFVHERALCFSDNNHMARRAWYEEYVWPQVGGRRTFMEDVVRCCSTPRTRLLHGDYWNHFDGRWN